jgi:uncharacterized membrane protein
MFRSFRKAFIAGLFTLLPLGITAWLLSFLLNSVGNPAGRLFFGRFFLDLPPSGAVAALINSLAIVLVIALVAGMGYVSRYVIGRYIIRGTERIIDRMPLIRTIYGTAKQIVNTFSDGHRAVFQHVVLVEFPRAGTYALGFLSGEMSGEMSRKTGKKLVSVFIPTTPNPTSGFLILAPEDQCITLEMSIADAIKSIISGGAFIPSDDAEKTASS